VQSFTDWMHFLTLASRNLLGFTFSSSTVIQEGEGVPRHSLWLWLWLSDASAPITFSLMSFKIYTPFLVMSLCSYHLIYVITHNIRIVSLFAW